MFVFWQSSIPIPRLWFFVPGVTSMFAVNCSDVVLFTATNGHPQIGALRNLSSYKLHIMIPWYTFLFNYVNGIESEVVGVLRPPLH